MDAATVRAVATEAGVSLGVVHYCFRDKDELLSAMAHEIMRQKLTSSLLEMPERGNPRRSSPTRSGCCGAAYRPRAGPSCSATS